MLMLFTHCLGAHDWKLDLAVDNYFQAPERYNSEPSRSGVDRKRLEALWQKYKGKKVHYF
jgi:DCN1-like protein 1/2